MPCSEKQLAANRLNAKRSTGPRSAEGKRISSQNARKHGLRSRDFDPNQYVVPEHLVETFVEFWNDHPPTSLEEFQILCQVAIKLALTRSLCNLEDDLLFSLLSKEKRTSAHMLYQAGALSAKVSAESHGLMLALHLSRANKNQRTQSIRT